MIPAAAVHFDHANGSLGSLYEWAEHNGHVDVQAALRDLAPALSRLGSALAATPEIAEAIAAFSNTTTNTNTTTKGTQK